jgi:hypothetical protein
MVVKMVVGPIAELIEEAYSGPSCALLRHRRGATNETSVLLGSRASSRQLLPSKCNEVTRLVRAYAIPGSATRSSRTSEVNRSRSEPSR